jgi:hypothetical protein
MTDLTNALDPEGAQIRELMEQRKFDDALPLIEARLRRSPRDGAMLQALSVTCLATTDAAREARLLEELLPNVEADGTFLAYYAQALGNAARFDESIKTYERARALRPDDHAICVAYALALLRQGEYARGWEMYEHREAMPEVSQFSRQINRPRYTGGNLNKRVILLLGEQGLGDTIMFARYAPLLAKRGGQVILAAHPEIADLLRTIPGVTRVVRFGEAMPNFHTYARLLSLPKIFDTTLWNIPHDVPYIRAPWGRVEHWRARLANDPPGKKIGLVWAGSAKHTNDARRSMHLADFSPLGEIHGATFYSLQKGARQEETQNPPGNLRLMDLGNEIRDLTDLAALLDVLDLLITVDTAPAHVAGAMGKNVWTLLPQTPDWRWMLNRADSPWYPSMRILRQPAMNDWAAVVLQLRDALAAATR